MAVVGIDFVANARNLLQEIDKVQGSSGTLNALRREGIKVLGEEMRAETASARAMLNSARVREQAGRAAVQGAQHAATATRATQALSVAQDAAEGSSRQLRASTINLGNQFMDLGVMLQGGSSPTRALIMQAPQMLDALRGMSDGVGGVSAAMARLLPFAASLSVVTVAVVALGGAWLYAADAAKEAEETAAAAAAAADDMQRRHAAIASVRGKAADDEALSLKRVTSSDLARRDAVDEVNKAYGSLIAKKKEDIALHEQSKRAALDALRPVFGDDVTHERVMGASPMELSAHDLDQYRKTVNDADRAIADLNTEVGALGTQQAITAAKTGMAAAAEDRGTDARRRGRKATTERISEEERLRRERAKLLELLAAELKAEEERAARFRGAIDDLKGQTLASERLVASKLELIALDEKARAAAAVDAYKIASKEAIGWEQRQEAAKAFIETIRASHAAAIHAEDEYYNELERKRQADLRRTQEAAQAKLHAELEPIRIALDYAQRAADLASQITNATLSSSMDKLAQMQAYQAKAEDYLTASQKQQLKERIDAQRAAAIRAFEINKAAALAGAVVNTASAVVAALDDAPWPFNLALSAGAGIAGGIQIATIAAEKPAFHSGGIVTADLLPGESVLNRRATEQAGRQGIDRMNAGASSGQGPIVIEYRHGHKVVDRAVSAVVRRGGSTRAAVTGLRTSPGFR